MGGGGGDGQNINTHTALCGTEHCKEQGKGYNTETECQLIIVISAIHYNLHVIKPRTAWMCFIAQFYPCSLQSDSP